MAGKGKSEGKKIEVRNVNVPSYRVNVDAEKYGAIKAALLKVLPARDPGLTQMRMFKAVRPVVSKSLFPGPTHMWWVKCV